VAGASTTQAGELAASQPGVQGEDPQRREAVVDNGAKECGRLLGGPYPHLLALASRHTRPGRRVCRDELPTHRVGESAMEHAVGELYRRNRQRPAVHASVVEQRRVPRLDVER
jgi:hypothetical protein